jgi:hypothetical protein
MTEMCFDFIDLINYLINFLIKFLDALLACEKKAKCEDEEECIACEKKAKLQKRCRDVEGKFEAEEK